MNLSLFQLEVLKSLAEMKSFTAAAERHEITQSAVSQIARSMAGKLHTTLLKDHSKKLLLTREGRRFYEFAKEVVEAYAVLRTDLAAMEEGGSETIRISVADTIDLRLLQANIERFNVDYPLVELRIEQRNSKLITQDIKDNYADFGIVVGAGTSRLETIPYSEDDLVIICHPRHALAAHAEVSLASVAHDTFVGLHGEHPLRREIEAACREPKVPYKPVMEFEHIGTLKCAVELAEGIAIVPQATVNQGLSPPVLAVVRIKGSPRCRHTLVYHKGHHLPRAMKNFIEMSFPARQPRRDEHPLGTPEVMDAAPEIAPA